MKKISKILFTLAVFFITLNSCDYKEEVVLTDERKKVEQVIEKTNVDSENNLSTNGNEPKNEIIVDDFSDRYYGKIQYSGSLLLITIYDKITQKKLFDVEGVQPIYGTKTESNVIERPYGDHSIIIYKDLNFDGINDFALMNAQKGCYWGPSFAIYLASDQSFVYSEDFSLLASHCGFFEIDEQEKKLYTMSKAGCCLHWYSEFIVEDNKPKKISVIEDEVDRLNGVRTITTEKLTNDVWGKAVEKIKYQEGMEKSLFPYSDHF